MLMRTTAEAEPAVVISRTSHRKLDPLLVETDVRLQKWATWAAPWYASRGFPVRPTGPVAACNRSSSISDCSAWPAPVLVVDEAAQRLCWQLASATMAQYFCLDLVAAQRATVYAEILQHFATLRPTIANRAREAAGTEAFRRNVDRARWSLRHALQSTGNAC
jgi:hypothetical protein